MVEPAIRAGSEQREPRIFLQSVPGLLQSARSVSLRVCPRLRCLAHLWNLSERVGSVAPLGILPDWPGLCRPYLWPDFPHGARRPPARDESLLIGHLHRLGSGRVRTGAGTDL